VLVADDDPAFEAAPTKPIGAFLDEDEARRVARERGWHLAPDSGRGWRRMVPSPRPLRILEVDHVRRLAEGGVLVVAAGGGGIPVAWRDGHLVGLDAVVDKDRCAAELAVALQADLLVLVTSVPRVQIGFGTPASRAALRLTVSDALRHLEEGEFPPGSMGPKIEGATRFAAGGGSAVIADAAHLATAVRGHHGTWIVPDHDGPSVFAPAPVAA
jgi:carbamate kinase